MNMKTNEQILDQESITLPILTRGQALHVMDKAREDERTQFKSPSPVSQQLTSLINEIEVFRGEGDIICDDMSTEIRFDEIIKELRHLSISPDAQKEIEEIRERYRVLKDNFKIVSDLLTSKESDVKRAGSLIEKALKKINNDPPLAPYDELEMAIEALKGNK